MTYIYLQIQVTKYYLMSQKPDTFNGVERAVCTLGVKEETTF